MITKIQDVTSININKTVDNAFAATITYRPEGEDDDAAVYHITIPLEGIEPESDVEHGSYSKLTQSDITDVLQKLLDKANFDRNTIAANRRAYETKKLAEQEAELKAERAEIDKKIAEIAKAEAANKEAAKDDPKKKVKKEK